MKDHQHLLKTSINIDRKKKKKRNKWIEIKRSRKDNKKETEIFKPTSQQATVVKEKYSPFKIHLMTIYYVIYYRIVI